MLKDLTTFKAVTFDKDGKEKEVNAKVIRTKKADVVRTVSIEGITTSRGHTLLIPDKVDMDRSNLKCKKCKGVGDTYGTGSCKICGSMESITGYKPLIGSHAVKAGMAKEEQSYERWYHVLLEDGKVHLPFEIGSKGILSEPMRHEFGTGKRDELWEFNE